MTPDDTTAVFETATDASPSLAGAPRVGERAGELWLRLTRAPAAWVALLVAASTAARAAIGLRVPAPWILPDEIVYSELAKSIAAGHLPAVRGVPVWGWGEVYPTLVAPAWALIGDPVDAHHAALAGNALVMSSAAVPAYLLARLFLAPRMSFAVAAMTVLVPSMVYTGVVMTENACYPVFLLALYLVARAVRQPTIAAQALALIGLAVLAFTRIQGLALVGAYALAVVLYAVTAPAARTAYLRRLAPSVAVAIAATLAPATISAATGHGPFAWLGSRSGTFSAFQPAEVPRWFVYLAGGLVLYVAAVPALAGVVVLGRGFARDADERLRLYAAVALPAILAVLASIALVSASFDVDGRENLNERYVFYVVPLLFLGLGLWIEEGMPRPRRLSWVAVACCGLLAAAVPLHRLHYNSGFQSPGVILWIASSLNGAGLAAAALLFTLACGALWMTCRRDRQGRLWLLVGLWMTLGAVFAVGSAEYSASDSASASRPVRGVSPTWIEDAVPDHARVVALWDQRSASRVRPDPVYFRLMVAEFFNPAVGSVYRIGPRTYYEAFLPTVPVTLGQGGGIVDSTGRAPAADYVLAPCSVPVAGDVVARAAQGTLTLVRVAGPITLLPRSRCAPGRA